MGVIIYPSGEATIYDLTEEQKKEILNIKRWGDPIFKITPGDVLEFDWDTHEGLTPLKDCVEDPLKKVLNIVGKEIDGLFFVSCPDCSDYDHIAIFVKDGKLIYKNSEIVNATTEELEEELARRKGIV